jgi:cob(I)alamin adenosyltransferase
MSIYIRRPMKIYTKTGDKGTTGLAGGTRVVKHHIRIDSYGTIDELNSWLGLIRGQEVDRTSYETLLRVQNTLFTIGALLASDPGNKKRRGNFPELEEADTLHLEEAIDRMNESLPPITHFILPGGHPLVSHCHIARTVCRRAERLISALNEKTPVNKEILVYINRLSDYLFVLSRKLSADLKAAEIKWIPGNNS